MKTLLGRMAFLGIATPALLHPAAVLAQGTNPWGVPPQNSNPWGPPAQQNNNPWGTGGGTTGPGFGQQGNGSLSFPAPGVICDSSVNVCFNATGAALFDTEREFGRRARLSLENNLVNSPIIDVTFADGRYCNFSLRGCWTNRQRTIYDQQLNPWVFGANSSGGTQGGQGTVIGGAGSNWGQGGSGMNPMQPPGNSFQPPFTRTRQSGTCNWMNAGTSIYNGSCSYEILQNNTNGTKTLAFTFDRLPMSNQLRTIRFSAAGNNPWTIQMPNGSTATVQSSVNASQSSTRISMGWSNALNLSFRSFNQATTAQLNQAMQVVDANGQVQASDAESLGQALGGLLQQLFGGN
ncbi:hypothetical protein [Cyanobium gracile]|uniref:Uncharacterized protein n=1 Tax=Cyanobium gracile UHCC 0281 TaxID=3110309 RepID=A0ABU5SST0_9CYAN|nr:hypothetical protein [Cyanobium gracile]MEA5441132.1 hypothetical protein [Cyanobium gracile UHCC 0281]